MKEKNNNDKLQEIAMLCNEQGGEETFSVIDGIVINKQKDIWLRINEDDKCEFSIYCEKHSELLETNDVVVCVNIIVFFNNLYNGELKPLPFVNNKISINVEIQTIVSYLKEEIKCTGNIDYTTPSDSVGVLLSKRECINIISMLLKLQTLIKQQWKKKKKQSS
jgi:hypothetical protein